MHTGLLSETDLSLIDLLAQAKDNASPRDARPYYARQFVRLPHAQAAADPAAWTDQLRASCINVPYVPTTCEGKLFRKLWSFMSPERAEEGGNVPCTPYAMMCTLAISVIVSELLNCWSCAA